MKITGKERDGRGSTAYYSELNTKRGAKHTGVNVPH